MARYALLDNAGAVTRLLDISDPAFTPADIAPGTSGWVDVSGDVQNGDVHQPNGSFLPPEPSPPSQNALIAYANTKQWALATSGYTVMIADALVCFDTSVTAMSLIGGKAQRFQQSDAPASVDWQTGPTSFVTISAADFMSAAKAIADFVQAAFDALKVVIDAIVAGSLTSFAEVDAADWPANS